MAAPVPSKSNMPARLKGQLDTVEKFFAEGNLKNAKMHASMAEYSFRSHREAQRAHVAMKVHHAAASNKDDHHAILAAALPLNGGKPPKMTYDEVRMQHAALCDLLDPAKSESAAAAAAFKLVNRAFAALMDIRKSEAAPAHPPPRPRLTPLLPVAARPNGGVRTQAPVIVEEPAEPAEDVIVDVAPADEPKEQQGAVEEDDGYSGGTGRRSRRGKH